MLDKNYTSELKQIILDKANIIKLNNLKERLNLPVSNVLYFELENNGWCCVRPSGTEPKIKFYFGVKGNNKEEAEIKLSNVKEDLLILAM